MKISRAGKQTKAYWAAEQRAKDKWENDGTHIFPENGWQLAQERGVGFATGWMAGVAWCKRNWKGKARSFKSSPNR